MFERDYGRLVHSAAFRRLQSKTQVLGLGESDFYRTRLTHSIEVSQVANGIVSHLQSDRSLPEEVKQLLPGAPLISSICLAHDVGHPPFGHGGEVALYYAMHTSKGFEGNAQTLRILTSLEAVTEKHGLDLTRRTLLGVLKYPIPYSVATRQNHPEATTAVARNGFRKLRSTDWKPPKCFYDEEEPVVEWILDAVPSSDRDLFLASANNTIREDPADHLKAKYKAFDTTIMDIADDISYGIHDLEDAIHMGLILQEEVAAVITEVRAKVGDHWFARYELGNLECQLFSREKWRSKRAVGALVNACVAGCNIGLRDEFESPLLSRFVRMDGPSSTLLDALKELVVKKVIKSPAVQTLEYRGQQVVLELFEALSGDPDRLLPPDTKQKMDRSLNFGISKDRIICDHISGMTDEYATKVYERLFMPRRGNLFQKI